MLAGHLQDWWTEWVQEGVRVAWAKSWPAAPSRADDRFMAILPSRITKRTGARRIWYRFSEADLGIGFKQSETARDAALVSERRVKERHAFDAAVAPNECRRQRVNPLERKRFELTCQTSMLD